MRGGRASTEMVIVKRTSWGTSLLALAVAAGCSAPRASRPAAAFGGVAGPLIIAHRGGALEAPPNTVAAVAQAVAAGADWQEIDVTLSHDAEVVAVAAGPVPTLDELLAVPGGRLVIGLRPDARPVLLVDEVIASIHRARAADRVALASSRIDLLDAAYAREPSVPLVGIIEKTRDIEEMLLLPIVVLAVPPDLVEAARAAAPPGLALWCWAAPSVATAEEAIARGAHAVVTDVPAALVRAWRTPPPVVLPLGP